ncbi:MAG: Na+/H+ antiporter NhaC family protein [Calditrichaceae bacterium]|nr:Na+/H+ antiporter NhaC family protein [Calditrichaceae bacterium]MBN2709246.1 Na+/H+ antiporter NhaC family protein [Calditrichaceae bacterium]RQV96199.1 MAG: Na+/H+ antiporter NhaC family protein [Calditrichota bacterium]
MKYIYCIVLILITGLCSAQDVQLELNDPSPVYLTGIDYDFELKFDGCLTPPDTVLIYLDNILVESIPANPEKYGLQSSVSFTYQFQRSGAYRFSAAGYKIKTDLKVIPGWLSILPPLAAILLALITRQVLIALFAGIWLGALFIFGYNPFSSFLYTLTDYIGRAPADSDHMAILIFSLTLGGMVGVISRAGGTQGIVKRLSRFASTSKRGQLVTWLMGILIFFDDYANTLIVGNTMRPLTDKLKISREKLSFLVDSTAAPVANIAIISTWVGYEISLINTSMQELGLNQNAYITFIKTIPYNFYPVFALFFGLIIALSGRDMFSMHKAEKRAAESGLVLKPGSVPLADLSGEDLNAKKDAPLRWYNALIPVATVILTTLGGLWFTGIATLENSGQSYDTSGLVQYVSAVIGNSDAFSVLMWAAFIGSFSAIILAVSQKILNMNEAVMAWVSGVKAMVMAALILTLAWAIGNICIDLNTAGYVIEISRDLLSPRLLPVISFVIAGVIAFATGTSWGTMAILMPIIIPLAYELPLNDPVVSNATAQAIFLSAIASVLAGATFGDHCSPISDTTIMSSMAAGADHIDHVRTQLPYALITAAASILLGYLLTGYGIPAWLSLISGFFALLILLRLTGKKLTDKTYK